MTGGSLDGHDPQRREEVTEGVLGQVGEVWVTGIDVGLGLAAELQVRRVGRQDGWCDGGLFGVGCRDGLG